MKYVVIQPEQEPPINPGEQPVPITGTTILIITGICLGLYLLWFRNAIKKK